ncbi:phosphopentomutase [Tepidimicrobium xylanilyticum]|uniref:Phosphopentomutase n=1 Tax=Tepidimicrobium xylanilyticum TaxID=1123352 RepID=A0A1H2RER4_9FIRM|nr:phosphopentomutase [Tepidimicrobium xylanilyticum]SDW17956.1 Phosphopentomutase [Tepidimicrobium xylanilyticum]
MKRAIVVVVDSLGVGHMEDVYETRPQDVGANTFIHLLDKAKKINIPNFERLGINKILKHERLNQVDNLGSYGILNLEHYGADSYVGHQEIMGTKPKKPLLKPFSYFRNEVIKKLEAEGHKVTSPDKDKPYILVDDLVVVADNIETDYGQIYNVTAPLDYITFEEVIDIGRKVRNVVKVNRVIALGGKGVTIEKILNSIETREDGLTGVNSPKSGVYNKGYLSRHLGYGVAPDKQISNILATKGYKVTLIGKMQDVIECEKARRIPVVDTEKVMQQTLDSMNHLSSGIIAATVQETDLAGHAQDVEKYAEKLMIVDKYIGHIMNIMRDEDILFITADHGNDPTIGFSQHTREKTFLLVYGKRIKKTDLGERSTLSDIAATISDYFNVDRTENGISFLPLLKL